MVPFTKPRETVGYEVMGERAAREALSDAGICYEQVQQAYVGWVYGDSTSGQAALYGLGLTGIPIVNVNNNCSTGSTALFLARQAVASGAVDCALALGFEQMVNGALKVGLPDRASPLARFDAVAEGLYASDDEAPPAPRYFGGAGQEHMDAFGTSAETFAKIVVKARRHAAHNPFAVFRDQLNEEQVLASPRIFGPLTRLMCCPPTCGAAAAVVCSEEFARRHELDASVIIRAQAMTTDFPSTFAAGQLRRVVGYDMTVTAARQVYQQAGVGPEEIEVVELHDCFATNELLCYEGLGLTEEGSGEKFVVDGDNTYGGRVVTNPSGGLLAKGHPLGATGLAQAAELVWQLRGTAGARQVEGARHALAHNLGLGGACVVTLYAKVDR
jgi:acetyl-CoA acetyltransferase